MFSFLKDKLKGAVSRFSKSVEETAKEQEVELPIENTVLPQTIPPSEEKEESFVEMDADTPELAEKIEIAREITKSVTLPPKHEESKKGFFSKITSLFKKEAEEEYTSVVESKPQQEVEATKQEEEKVDTIEKKSEEIEVSEEPKVAKRSEVGAETQVTIEPREEVVEEKLALPQENRVESKEEEKISTPTQQEPITTSKQREEEKEISLKYEKPEPEHKEQSNLELPPLTSIDEPPTPKKEETSGFFAKLKEKVLTKTLSNKQFEDLFWDLEVAMLENNVAMEVVDKIKEDMRRSIVDTPIRRGKVEDTIATTLRRSIEEILHVPTFDLLQRIRQHKPAVICFVGINGSGKTTSIAKVAHLLKESGHSVVIGAADTFRAAAIEQLEIHAERLGIKMIKHDYGSDAAAVAFDTISYAKAKGIDVVLLDTAGRLHSNINLMDELKKVKRVAKPDFTLFVGESITGNDCVEQAKQFHGAVGIDGIILSKADVDEKGGAAISVSYITQKPIIYLGVGQEYKDLVPFRAEKVLSSLGL